jgi:hypothetical protein
MLDKNINYNAGEDQIEISRNTKGVWTITIKHNCKIVHNGIKYLLDVKPGVEKLLNEYDKIRFNEKEKK